MRVLRAPGILGRIFAQLALLAALAGCGSDGREPAAGSGEPRPATPSVRITMAALHQAGGVPPGWRLSLPPGDVAAGRRTFVDAGCHACHRVDGEPFSSPTAGPGPDLTGMGSHHPPEYFAESILNPDAVLVEGPGWIDADGHSVMPGYPDLTLRQLADLVAYLKSLRSGGAAEMLATAPMAQVGKDLPAAPPGDATLFYVQVYDVRPGELEPFERWFHDEGARAFLAHDGLLDVRTWVDLTRDGPSLVTVLGFRDEAAVKRFLDDPATDALGRRFDDFIGPHLHRLFRRLPLYPAASLSAP
jgi:mono/diheme cytochrome c family protein